MKKKNSEPRYNLEPFTGKDSIFNYGSKVEASPCALRGQMTGPVSRLSDDKAIDRSPKRYRVSTASKREKKIKSSSELKVR